jgi:hypothetical protein
VAVLEFAQIEQKGQLWLKEPHITKYVTVSLNFSKAPHPEKFSQNWTEVDAYGSQNIAITQYMGHDVAPKTLELLIEMTINAVVDPIRIDNVNLSIILALLLEAAGQLDYTFILFHGQAARRYCRLACKPST